MTKDLLIQIICFEDINEICTFEMGAATNGTEIMARLKPRKNLIDLKNKFSKKNSLPEFKTLFSCLREEMTRYPLDEKQKGGEYEQMIGELAILNRIAAKCKPSHIEYTGWGNSSKDGVLYFNEKTQDVEIVSITDKSQKQSYRKKTPIYKIATPGVSIPSVMKEYNWPEDQAREYLKSSSIDQLAEDFLYDKIVSVLENKKREEQYKGFWLLIAYSPQFHAARISKEETRDFILKKIQSEKKELVCSTRRIFKKIIFVPFEEIFVPFEEQDNHQVFEWRHDNTCVVYN